MAPNTTLLVAKRGACNAKRDPLLVERVAAMSCALSKRRGEETPKRTGEDTHVLSFSRKEKRRDLTSRDADGRTWTLQSAKCCVKTKLVSVQKHWRLQTELENTSENREF